MKKIIVSILLLFFMLGCASKQPQLSQSATILIKTPAMKFYDNGFITKYDDYTKVQIFNAGNLVLELLLYKDEICKDSLRCQSSVDFNAQYLHKSYQKDFLKKLFDSNDKKIVFKDMENHILIKIVKH